MKHEWMRQEKVDISKYLPAFLGLDSRFQVTNQADSKEHERLRVALQDVFDQFFVKSATWGLDEWEELVGLTTDSSKDNDVRRQAVLAKLHNPESVTESFLTRLINRYIGDSSGVVKSYPEEYRVEFLYQSGEVLDYKGLCDAIRTYIPAHLGYAMIDKIFGSLKMFAVTSEYEREVLSEEIKTLADGKSNVYVGIGSVLTKYQEIRPAEFDRKINNKVYVFGTCGVLDREVITVA